MQSTRCDRLVRSEHPEPADSCCAERSGGGNPAQTARGPGCEPKPDSTEFERTGKGAALDQLLIANKVFPLTSIALTLYASYLVFVGSAPLRVCVLLWVLTIGNLLWTRVGARLSSTVRGTLRSILFLPVVTGIYVYGEGPLERLLIPAQIMIVGCGILYGVQTGRVRTGSANAALVASSIAVAGYRAGIDSTETALMNLAELLVIGMSISITSAHLGRTLAVSDDHLREAQRQQKRAQDALRQLEKTQRELIHAAHAAGMAEVSSGVLHNVGNVLSAVSVTLEGAQRRCREIPRLHRVTALLDEQTDIGAFLASPRGSRLPRFLRTLSERVNLSVDSALTELKELRGQFQHIHHIIAMQQEFARPTVYTEKFTVQELFEAVLRFPTIAPHAEAGIIRSANDALPQLETDRHKLFQIVVNLVNNAIHFARDGAGAAAEVTLLAARKESRIQITVRDNGPGISEEVRPKLFRHGFTTRAGGHGFGLHMSAVNAKQLGGEIRVESTNSGQGAAFVVEVPILSPQLDAQSGLTDLA